MTIRALALGIAISLAHSPADAAQPSEAPARSQQSGSRWEVISIDGMPAPRRSDYPAATLFMGTDGAIGGTWECNSGGTAYVRWTKDGGFSGAGGPIIFTLIGCSDQDKNGLCG
ncbi:hypothetical protein GRI75_10445 [Altererythrobacter soli]|uniref:DUF306 domain-containing protein n=1 Tax=Croceibacterium soli TaxID=1739690 RepID=A0A6I4UWC4_9SPHN|nr:hypothetical protein [Croceibacterium soli]MXP42059.1 hypothetical protein [Croceibacterium soli]